MSQAVYPASSSCCVFGFRQRVQESEAVVTPALAGALGERILTWPKRRCQVLAPGGEQPFRSSSQTREYTGPTAAAPSGRRTDSAVTPASRTLPPGPPPSRPGGARHAAGPGSAPDNPSDPSTRAIAAGPWIAANTRRGPAHCGQISTETPNTRCSNAAHGRRRRAPLRLLPPCGTRRRWRRCRSAKRRRESTLATSAASSRSADATATAPPSSPCRQPPTSPASPSRRGTTRERRPDAGARTPWYVTKCFRGRGTRP